MRPHSWLWLLFDELKIGAEAHVRITESFKLAERQVVIEVAFGGTAIREHDHGVLMHVRIVGSE
jgi:hypothetical protein